MAVHFTWQIPQGSATKENSAIGTPLLSERNLGAGVNSTACPDGCEVLIFNDGTTPVFVAHGEDPDSGATASTNDTTAAYCVLPGATRVRPKTGDVFQWRS